MQDNISNDLIKIAFRQLGAKEIKTTTTKMNVIIFEINEKLTVSYLCNAKDEEKIYLQRIEPYPIRHIKFESVDHIIDFVTEDIARFKNATNSSNYDLFLEIADKVYRVDTEVEHLFLNHNVNRENLEHIDDNLGWLLEKIAESRNQSKKVEF
ncbi:MAG: hypothetical protein RR967_02035 [Anaerovoracaceae bacterium]